jgi:hypothetical protein
MNKIIVAVAVAVAFALPLAVLAANPPGYPPAASPVPPKAAVPGAGSGKNQSEYKAKMAVCQQQAKGLMGDKKQKAVTACMHA